MRLREGWLPGALNERHADEKPRKAEAVDSRKRLLCPGEPLGLGRDNGPGEGFHGDGRNPGQVQVSALSSQAHRWWSGALEKGRGVWGQQRVSRSFALTL